MSIQCDECGKFISYNDLDSGKAVHKFSGYSLDWEGCVNQELYESLCRDHHKPKDSAL